MDLSLATCVSSVCGMHVCHRVLGAIICLMMSIHQAVEESDACCLGALLSQLDCSKHGSTLLVLGVS